MHKRCGLCHVQEKEERQRKKAKVAARSKLSFMGEEEEEENESASTAAEEASANVDDAGVAKADTPALPHHRRFAKLGAQDICLRGCITAVQCRVQTC